MLGAIVIGSFELIDDLASGVDRKPLFADGGPCNIELEVVKVAENEFTKSSLMDFLESKSTALCPKKPGVVTFLLP